MKFGRLLGVFGPSVLCPATLCISGAAEEGSFFGALRVGAGFGTCLEGYFPEWGVLLLALGGLITLSTATWPVVASLRESPISEVLCAASIAIVNVGCMAALIYSVFTNMELPGPGS